MKLLDITAFTGPSVYSKRPLVRLAIQPDRTAALPVDQFMERAARGLPDEGPWRMLRGQLARLAKTSEELDWPRVLGGIAVALQDDHFEEPLRHMTLAGEEGALTLVLVETNEPAVGSLAARFAFEIIRHLLTLAPKANPTRVKDRLAQASRRFIAARSVKRSDPNTRVIVESAMKHAVPLTRPEPNPGFIVLGQGHKSLRMREFFGDSTSLVAFHIAIDKHLTARVLASVGVPVPAQRLVRSQEDLKQAIAEIGFPLVIKGRTGSQGTTVTTNIRSQEEVGPAVIRARSAGSELVVERHIEGEDFRATVIGGRMIAAARRLPAQVIGDGQRSVRALVEAENARRRSSGRFAHWIVELAIDADSERMLAGQGLSPDSVPASGQRARLRSAGNFSQGGISEDVTEEVHPEVVAVLERAARAVGLDMAGIDLLTADITKPLSEAGGAINEVNDFPAARAHYITPTGPRDVAGAVIEHLFPQEDRGRIPTVAISGQGSAAVCELAARALETAGLVVGASTARGIAVGQEIIRTGDHAHGRGAQLVLQDRRVQAGVFEMAPRSLFLEGLCWDACDIGVVTSAVHDDPRHGPLLARAQRLLVEVARKAVVLNADDEACLAMVPHAAAPIWWVSQSMGQDDLAAQLKDGANAILLAESDGVERLVHHRGESVTPLMRLTDLLPAVKRNDPRAVARTLFGVAIAVALGLELDSI